MARTDHQKEISKIHTFADDVKAAQIAHGDQPVNKPAPTPPKQIPPTTAVKPASQPKPKPTPPIIKNPLPPSPPIVEPVAKSQPSKIKEPPLAPPKPHPSSPTPPSPRKLGFRPENETSIPGSHKSSLLTNEDDLFDIKANEGSGAGSIVTDTKHNRFRLIPAVIQAIKNWFAVKQTEHQAAQAAQPKVERSNERADVIKAAAARSAIAPRDDYQQTSGRLKEVPRDAKASNLEIAAVSEVPEPRWTYLVEEPASEPVVTPDTYPLEAPVPIPEPEPEETKIQTEPEFAVTPMPQPEFAAAPLDEASQESAVPPDEQPDEVETTSPSEPVISEELTTEEIDETPTEALPTETPTKAPAGRWYRATPPASSSYNPATLVAVCGVAILLGVVTALWWFGGDEANTEVASVSVLNAITATTQIPFELPTTHDDLMSALQTAGVQAGAGVVQIYPINNTETGAVEAASAAQIVGVLEPRAPGSFIRTIDTISFGMLDGTTPFIILHVSSFDTAFGGMLEWETTLSSDLAPWFGEPVTESFDRSARTVDSTRGAFYTDTVLGNRDVRILFDATGTERIIYSFIDRTTILITTTPAAFTTLAPLVR